MGGTQTFSPEQWPYNLIILGGFLHPKATQETPNCEFLVFGLWPLVFGLSADSKLGSEQSREQEGRWDLSPGPRGSAPSAVSGVHCVGTVTSLTARGAVAVTGGAGIASLSTGLGAAILQAWAAWFTPLLPYLPPCSFLRVRGQCLGQDEWVLPTCPKPPGFLLRGTRGAKTRSPKTEAWCPGEFGPVLCLTCCVTLGKSHVLLEPCLLYLWKGNDSIHATGLWHRD